MEILLPADVGSVRQAMNAYLETTRAWVGGRGLPHQAEPLEQDYRAVRLRWIQGTGAWSVCGT